MEMSARPSITVWINPEEGVTPMPPVSMWAQDRVIVLAKVVTTETGINVNLSIGVWIRRVDAISWVHASS